jgi:hypothetical protein
MDRKEGDTSKGSFLTADYPDYADESKLNSKRGKWGAGRIDVRNLD